MIDAAHLGRLEPPEPSKEDYAVAEVCLARLPDAPHQGSPEYEAQIQHLAHKRAEEGALAFDLFCGVREPIPSRPLQVALVALRQRLISEQRHQAIVISPPTRETFEAVSATVLESLARYKEMLGDIAELELHPSSATCTEADVDRLCEAILRPPLDRVLPLEFTQVDHFLTEMRRERNAEQIRCGEFVNANAHALVNDATSYWAGAWFAVKRQRREGYEKTGRLDLPSAAHTLYHSDERPNPQELEALLIFER